MSSQVSPARIIGGNDTVVAVLLHQRIAKSDFPSYGTHHAGVVQLKSKDNSWASRRMVVSLGGSGGESTLAAGMLPMDSDQLHAALRVAEFYLNDGALRAINGAVEAQFTHCLTEEEAQALREESYNYAEA